MRALSILLIMTGIGAGAVTAYIAASHAPASPAASTSAREFVSGPQPGKSMPGPFEPLHINGADAGEEACMFCKYGDNPVVMVFATRPGVHLTELVGKLESAATGAKRAVGACVVVTDTNPVTRASLERLAMELHLKHVVLAVIDGARLKPYALHPGAETTVIFFTKQVVRGNRALRAGELTEQMVSDIASEAARHYGAE